MTTKRLEAALSKTNLTGIINRGSFRKYVGERNIVEFYDQEGTVVALNVRSKNDNHDLQSDYTAGVFPRSIRSAVELFIN